MNKKNNRLFILRIFSFLYPFVYVNAYKLNFTAVRCHAPGAQGGTGGW